MEVGFQYEESARNAIRVQIKEGKVHYGLDGVTLLPGPQIGNIVIKNEKEVAEMKKKPRYNDMNAVRAWTMDRLANGPVSLSDLSADMVKKFNYSCGTEPYRIARELVDEGVAEYGMDKSLGRKCKTIALKKQGCETVPEVIAKQDYSEVPTIAEKTKFEEALEHTGFGVTIPPPVPKIEVPSTATAPVNISDTSDEDAETLKFTKEAVTRMLNAIDREITKAMTPSIRGQLNAVINMATPLGMKVNGSSGVLEKRDALKRFLEA